MDAVEKQVLATDARLNTHEAVCAERYEGIQESFAEGAKRMQRIEYMLYVIGSVVLLGPGFAAELLKKLTSG